MKKLFLFAMIGLLTLNSCSFMGGKRIRGNGIIKTETRSAGTYNGVDVSGALDVYVKQDSAYSVLIETDANLLEYIVVENSNGILKIHQREGTNLKSTRSIKVYVGGPSLKRFEASGACDIVSENVITSSEPVSINLSGASSANMELKAPKVGADLSGAGTVTLKGETKEFRVDGSGSSNINCFELMSETTEVGLSGAGDAEVFASVKLDVHVSGAADVKYKGNATVSQQISGAGSVKKAE
ncbi:MAG: head GIN domain-containing protein [Chitinophagaceae bacterium]